VLAHPDDEVLALGGRMERLAESKLICVTDGAPTDGADALSHGFATLDEYRAARRAELEAALGLAGLEPGIAGTLRLAGGERVADARAAFALPELSRAIAVLIEEFRPEAVLTHPYEGGHPDHDACAFAVAAAVRMTGERQPLVLEAPFYHAGPEGIETGCFLPGGGAGVIVQLSAAEQARKRERLACFGSQRETLQYFGVEREQFRLAPAYDFAQPPHAGQLFYERYPWGMDPSRFRQLAVAALADLGLDRDGSRTGEGQG
jgi:LmbE family N-acetylglucosaminyl deacetylase